jgi:hypothetical protein
MSRNILRFLGLLGASAATLGSSPASAQPAGGAQPAIRLLQTTGGLPGQSPKDTKRTSYQELLLATDGSAVQLKEFSDPERKVLERYYVARFEAGGPAPKTLIWELSPDGRFYREHSGDLNQNQRNRRVQELEQVRHLQAQYRGVERKAALDEMHLRPDGKREVTVAGGETQEVLGYPCNRLVVTENGRTIVDAFLTQALAGGRSYYELYRRLGVFSDEVVEKLRGVRGLPLRGRITVVTALPTYTLDVTVEKVEEIRVAPAEFQLPPGAEKLPEKPKFVGCPVCRKKVDTDAPGGVIFRSPNVWYFDSESCAREFSKRLPRQPGQTEDPFQSGGTGEAPGKPSGEKPEPGGAGGSETKPSPSRPRG